MQDTSVATYCSGMATSTPPPPCTVVIFGAAGDLARRSLIPALYALHSRDLLPEPFAVLGVARRPWDDQAYRTEMRQATQNHTRFQQATWEEFAQKLSFVQGDFHAPAPATYATVTERLHRLQRERHIPDQALLYLATAPELYTEIVQKSAEAGLLSSADGWRRVILEKPFGHDEASARDLDWKLHQVLDASQLYRIDHYLGKETVQNLLVFRLTNPCFEPIWNRDYIDHVQITVAETEGIGTRGKFYDATGVIRDMLQNHLLHLLCLIAMEPPKGNAHADLHQATTQVLEAIRPIDARTDCILGQYGRGVGQHSDWPAYREEEDIPASSTTPTFVALKLMLDNWRWAGVPFYLRTGKRLPRKVAEITLHFRPQTHEALPLVTAESLPGNCLTFRLQPDEGIHHTFLAKQPGPGMCLQQATMHFCYQTAFGLGRLPDAYEWLLLDAMQGDQTLFPPADWIYRAWSVLDPLVTRTEAIPPRDLPNYAAGTWGPAAAEGLLERDGYTWQLMP